MKIAALQMTSGDDIAANITQVEDLLQQAVQQNACFAALPENAFYMRREGTAAEDMPMHQHPGFQWASGAAKKYGIWLLIGSLRALEEGHEKPFNRSILLSSTGDVAAQYDKLHLFDVTLPNGHHYRESSQAFAGNAAVVAPLDEMTLGMSICYDVRFPQLYRELALKGAHLLTVPSAFTRPTGEAHWEILLRARAIENACYVIAPAQAGTHPGGRETWGHSMLIDPWGTVLAEAKTHGPEVIFAEADVARVTAIRQQIPVLQHHRAWGH